MKRRVSVVEHSLYICGGLLLLFGCFYVIVNTMLDPSRLEAADLVSIEPVKLKGNDLPNLVHVHTNVISGGLPEGDSAFKELADLGVKTIISVDGMTPDVEMAKKYGMRYVHLPHGYDGIPEQRVKELAKAVRELATPIYIHCHHGRHRSPAAASVACVSAGLISSDKAVAILKLAGTSSNYKGLHDVVRRASPFDPVLLKEFSVKFKEVQEIPPMAQAMVGLNRVKEHLDLIAKSKWRIPAEHPDLDPAHQVLMIREHYTELLRTKEVSERPSDFRSWLASSEAAARELELVLIKWHKGGAIGQPPSQCKTLLRRISSDCKACHLKYRDNP